MLSLYVPGTTFIHRAYAWLKLTILCVCGTGVMLISSPMIIGCGVTGVALLYVAARIPIGVVWRMTRTLLLFVLVIIGFQWLFSSASLAVLVGLRILFLVAAANLLTLTTSMSDLVATVETLLKPLSRFGLHPERVGLAISLALRFIPSLVEQSALIREAQAARGVKSHFTYLVPLIIRTLRMADAVGEALEVRGAGLDESTNPR